jgi:hypothetical protein
VSGSILDDVKKLLGLSPTDTSFDTDVIIHINSVFSIVTQLGLGSDGGIGIVDNTTTWTSLFGNDSQINDVKSYVFMRVKMLFDPPQTSFAIAAYEKQIQEFEWRLNVRREGQWWTDPNPPAPMYPDPSCWWGTI